jgi:hypothetical protein
MQSAPVDRSAHRDVGSEQLAVVQRKYAMRNNAQDTQIAVRSAQFATRCTLYTNDYTLCAILYVLYNIRYTDQDALYQ